MEKLCNYGRPDESADAKISALERQCEQLKALAESAVDLNHEINNPLLLIIGHAQLLIAKSDRLPAEVTRKLEKILAAAEKIRTNIQRHQEMTGALLEEESGE
jgi:nitrogen-specific signal transduction histidine kinase